jgi:lauroyl/myristoyl acyltransferase
MSLRQLINRGLCVGRLILAWLASMPAAWWFFFSRRIPAPLKLAYLTDINSMALAVPASPRVVRRRAMHWLRLRKTAQQYVSRNIFRRQGSFYDFAIRFANPELLDATLARGRGAIVASFHFVNHFALQFGLQRTYENVHTILADRRALDILPRAAYAKHVIFHHYREAGLFWRMRDVLRRNEILIVYQDVAPLPGGKSDEAPFRNGLTLRVARNLTAMLSFAAGTPIVPAINVSRWGALNEIRYFEPIEPRTGESAEEYQRRVAGTLFTLLGELVAQHPEHWEKWSLLRHHGRVLGTGDAPSPRFRIVDFARREMLLCRVAPLRIQRRAW